MRIFFESQIVMTVYNINSYFLILLTIVYLIIQRYKDDVEKSFKVNLTKHNYKISGQNYTFVLIAIKTNLLI